MSRTHIPSPLRQRVRSRAQTRCEYCLVWEEDGLLPYTIDHIIAEQHGGSTTFDNLALACIHCNRAKGPNIASLDPETGQIVPLFNPRRHSWSEHFRLEHETIEPLTPLGRATVRLLRLNTPERVQLRQALAEAGRYP